MAKRRRSASKPPYRLILDSGAVIALSRSDARARAALISARRDGAEVCIPAVVIAETVRGSARDAPVNRVINAARHVAGVDEQVARTAGALLGATNAGTTVDAMVVAATVQLGGGVVLTSDPRDLTPLAAIHPNVAVWAL